MSGISIILPAHQEAATIGDVVTGCLTHVPDALEILVVDDGSTDGTKDAAEMAGARVLRKEHNVGKGAALREGVEAARGDIVVVLDADGQDDPADIPRLVAPLEGGADLVIGSRFLGRFEPGAIAPVDRIGTRGLTAIFNAMFRTRLTDILAGYRAARRETLLRAGWKARGYDVEVDMLSSVVRSGGVVVEIGVRRMARAHGASGLRRFRDGSIILGAMVRARAGM